MLEYIIVYRKNGLPLYSKCYSDFCKAAFKEPALLSGFLFSLENFSEKLTEGNVLESIKMGQTTMFFNKTFPSRHSVVIGLKKPDPEFVEDTFEVIGIFLETEYKNTNWDKVDSDFAKNFENELLTKILIPALKHHQMAFRDSCPAGNQCPMKTLASEANKGTIWSLIKNNYAHHKAMVN
ncbi:MAG: hypothetical protein ACFFBD_10730 [Candidatus Hodarchaeota archaeon]